LEPTDRWHIATGSASHGHVLSPHQPTGDGSMLKQVFSAVASSEWIQVAFVLMAVVATLQVAGTVAG